MPELLGKLAQYPIAGCSEDPLPGEDIQGYIDLRLRSRLPIVLHHFPMGATYEVMMKPADAYMLGHYKIGDAIRRAGLFAADNSPFMLQNVGGNITRAMTTHMMAAFPTATFHFFSDCEIWSADVVDQRLEPTNGFLKVCEEPGLGVTLNRGELERLAALKLREQPKWIIRSRFENGTRMYHIADPKESIFMVRPDRRRLISMSYAAPIRTDYWDDDGTPEYRAMFGEVKTSLPGVTFGSHFPLLGKLAHKMAVVRSFRHGNGSHGSASALVAAGGNPTGACMGSLYSRVAGLTNVETGLPNNCLVVPATAGKKYHDLRAVPERITSVGTLPKSCSCPIPLKGSFTNST
jgi:hypothetical protein